MPAPGVMRYAVLGDTQGLSQLDQLVVDMNAYNTEFFVLPGDLVDTGGSSSWDSWTSITNAYNGERYMVPGNHDLPVGGDALWQSKFAWLPDSQVVDGEVGIDKMDYYFDKGDTRFISVTTDSEANGAYGQPAALDWLEAVLNDPATQAKEHVFVYSHHPVTYQNESGTGGTNGAWWQVMANSGVVDAFYAGHWHLYQPSQPDPHSTTWEATLGTGGGILEGHVWQRRYGFTLIDVNGPRVEASFISDVDGDGAFDDIVDQFVIADSSPKPSGLVGYYSFNFGNSNLDTATGALAKQNHGNFVDDATTVAGGILGKALSVDGAGDYADGGSVGDYTLAILGDLTISLHAQFDALQPGADQNMLVSYSGRIPGFNGIGQYPAQESTNETYGLRIGDDKRLQLTWEHDDASQVLITSTAAVGVEAGEWGHYMAVRDAQAMEVRFYFDGALLGAPVSFVNLPTGGANGFLHIGNDFQGDSGFDGLIDELTIYDEVLLPGDIFIGPTPGDLDGNGLVNLVDFTANFLPNFGTTVGMSGDPSNLMMGDLDVDGDVDLIDFDAFQGAYLAANPGAQPLSFDLVPEPGGLLLAAGAWWTLLVTGGRQRRWQTSFGAAAMLLLIAPDSQAATVMRDYQLTGSFADALGGPALIDGGGVLDANGYRFGSGQGLSLAGWDPTGQGDDYAIEFYAQFDVFGNGRWGKLTDFKNRSSDTGFYIHNESGHRLEFFNLNNPGPATLAEGQFHHVVLSRDEPGAGAVSVWLDGVQQWTFNDSASELAVANFASNVLHFFSDDFGSEHPAGYVDFIRIYDSAVSQTEVDGMVAGLPNYGQLSLNVDLVTGAIDLVNQFPESVTLRAYQLTSENGSLDPQGWTSWDDAGLDGDTWSEANPSATQLAELNLTSSVTLPFGVSRTLGSGFVGPAEDLQFAYLEPGNATPIPVPVTYVSPALIVGDLDFDDDIDSDDWMLFNAGFHKTLAGMNSLEAFQMGDMDGDFDNDYSDFQLFKSAYEAAHGPGSLAALLAVPEPGTAWLLLSACSAWVARKRPYRFAPTRRAVPSECLCPIASSISRTVARSSL